MSKPLKSKKHNIVFCLISERAITHQELIHKFSRGLDYDILAMNDILITAIDTAANFNTDRNNNSERHAAGETLSKLPGALRTLKQFLAPYKWYHIYMGACAVILLVALIQKLLIRYLF